MAELSTNEIAKASERIAGYVRHTPLLRLSPGEIAPAEVVLKLEQLQLTGTFKVRGAFNTLLEIDNKPECVIAASGGNHGIAVAYAAKRLGYRAEIFVPEIASPIKIEKLQALGARVHQTGMRYAESLAAMRRRQTEIDALDVHAYDQTSVVAGQGTVAREFEADASALDKMVIAVGGGGLIGGAMAWLGKRLPIVAVEPENAASLHYAMKAGEPVDVEVSGIAADSLGAKRIGDHCFKLARQTNPLSVLVQDDEIAAAQTWLWDQCRLIAEPGGATALAAVLSGRVACEKGQRIGVLICGGNADPKAIAR